MKHLFAYLTVFILGLSFDASAQTTAVNTGSATVSSTITVRIPAFASITLAENTSTTVSKDELIFSGTPKEKSKAHQLQTNHDWLMNVDRILVDVNKLGYAKTDPQKKPVHQVIYTATPK